MITLPRLILVSLAAFGDIWMALPKNKKGAWDFWFGERTKFFQRRSLLNTVNRLLRTEKIIKTVDKGEVRIQITPKGLKVLGINFNVNKFSRKNWDKMWRLVIFDIEEKSKVQRESLREKLKGLGFGMLQKSVWISPFPLENELNDYFHDRKIGGEVLVTRSHVLVEDQRGLASRVWNLEKINKEYKDLCEAWEDIETKSNSTEAFNFETSFFSLLLKDPFLPRELLPKFWLREKAQRIYSQEVNRILLGR